MGRRVAPAIAFFLGGVLLHSWNKLGASISEGAFLQFLVYGTAVIAQLVVLGG